MKKIFLLTLCFVFLGVKAQKSPLQTSDFEQQEKWVDSLYNTMTLQQKIGQLFMVQVFSSSVDLKKIKQQIQKYSIGGIIFSKGTPHIQAQLTNEFQSVSKIPLMIAMDAEWGLAMRLDSTYAYPWNMTLGAIKDVNLIEKVAKQISEHCNRMGVHLNFAPDVDINTNPKNPIIGNRSFGENKENVLQKSRAFIRGMHSQKVLSCAKHFPGHGDTSKDSHLELPMIDFDRQRLDEIELYPFSALANQVASVMIGHLNVPALEPENKPSSLSYRIVTELLKEEMGFNGLIFTDALSMKGVADYTNAGQADLQAFLAGNDVLLMPENLEQGVKKMTEAYHKNIFSEEKLAHSVKKILRAKYWVGLQNYVPIDTKNLYQDLNTLQDSLLTETIFKEAITLVKNDDKLLPINDLGEFKTAYLKLGNASGEVFLEGLRWYENVSEIKGKAWEEIYKEIHNFDRIIIGVHRSDKNPWVSYKFTASELELIQKISLKKQIILVVFSNPYALLDLPSVDEFSSIIVAYQNHKMAQQQAAQLIYGAIPFKGILPVSAHSKFSEGIGIFTQSLGRLQYGIPESVGVNSLKLSKIDSVVKKAIAQKMTPSAQVLVARSGKVIYQKSFGTHTYQSTQKVTNASLYDLASLTKILVTLPIMMQLFENQQFEVNDKLVKFLPQLKGTNKENITIVEALSHNARFQGWIPFYKKTIENQEYTQKYRSKKSEKYSVKVADNLFLLTSYKDSIFRQIVSSELLKKKSYLYSDLPYYLFQKYIENHYKSDLDFIVKRDFFKSLGAYSLTYNPLNYNHLSEIVPTENDTIFRKQIIQGYVHDQGAAMLGGIGGHAGLFGTANDVAKVMQMLLNKGIYAKKEYFSEKTFDIFNKLYYPIKENRRALGFDKPQPKGEAGPTCDCVSAESFGHSGFTGTYAWADPETKVVYVFLSNRTFPTAENKKLIKENIRTKIQKIIQNSIMNNL